MDPVQVIVSALAVGAARNVIDAGKSVLRQSYAKIKEAIASVLGRSSHGDQLLLAAEQNPPNRAQIEVLVRTTGIASHQPIVDAAVALLREADRDAPGIEGGIVGQINAAGGKVLAIGTNYGPITM